MGRESSHPSPSQDSQPRDSQPPPRLIQNLSHRESGQAHTGYAPVRHVHSSHWTSGPSENWPLAKVCFAKNHGTRLAQFARHKSISRHSRTNKSERTCCSLHRISSSYVILEQNRNTMQRPTRPLCSPFLIQRLSYRQRVGIDFQNTV